MPIFDNKRLGQGFSRWPGPRGLAACAVLALVTGCDAPVPWDREYTCEGQESSVAQFKGGRDSAVHKTYPLSLDLHVRDPHVLVKGTTTEIRSRSDDNTHFAVRSPSFWMAGGFDEHSGRLTLVEERTLTIDGREQHVLNSGTYTCHRQGGAPRT